MTHSFDHWGGGGCLGNHKPHPPHQVAKGLLRLQLHSLQSTAGVVGPSQFTEVRLPGALQDELCVESATVHLLGGGELMGFLQAGEGGEGEEEGTGTWGRGGEERKGEGGGEGRGGGEGEGHMGKGKGRRGKGKGGGKGEGVEEGRGTWGKRGEERKGEGGVEGRERGRGGERRGGEERRGREGRGRAYEGTNCTNCRPHPPEVPHHKP